MFRKLRDLCCDIRLTITLLPRDGRIYCNHFCRLGWSHLVETGFLCLSKAHTPFGDWFSTGTNELSVRVTWKAKAKCRIKQNWFLKRKLNRLIFETFAMEYGQSECIIKMLGRLGTAKHCLSKVNSAWFCLSNAVCEWESGSFKNINQSCAAI